MKSLKTIPALVLATSLMGCATTGGDPNAVVTQVTNATIKLCGFYPVAEQVANLVSIFVGGGAIIGQVEQIAQEICAAANAVNPPVVAPKSGRLRAARNITVIVNGVPVTGHFVR